MKTIKILLITCLGLSSLWSNNALLRYYGGTAAINLYTLSLSVNVMADTYAKEVYSAKYILETSIKIKKLIQYEMKLVLDVEKNIKLSKDDASLTKRVKLALNTLNNQLKSLLSYIKSSDPVDLKHFHNSRKQLEKLIKQITAK